MPYKIKSFNHRFSRRKIAVSAVTVVLLLAGSVAAFNYSNSRWSNRATDGVDAGTVTNKPGTQKLNLDPPTEAEKKQVEDNKDLLARQMTERQTPQAEGKKNITPQIIDAGQYGQAIEVRALIPDVYEASGTCTATFKQGSTSLTRTVAAIQGASTTSCTPLVVQRSDFSTAGKWTVTVSYASTSTQGVSDAKIFSIQ